MGKIGGKASARRASLSKKCKRNVSYGGETKGTLSNLDLESTSNVNFGSSPSWKSNDDIFSLDSPKSTSSTQRDASSLEQEHKYYLPYQRWIQTTYNSDRFQIAIAFLIFLNFTISAVHSQLVPEPNTPTDYVFHVFELLFSAIFLIELLFNMYGHFFLPFWQSGWNWFDFLVVNTSLISIISPRIPAMNILRLFRAFRVFRLFKRVSSLACIIDGVIASMIAIANAFLLITIMMSVWAIMGVEFFRKTRDQEFGNFLKSMFSMWQIMSMDSWSSEIARNVIYTDDMPLASIYFVSFLFIVGIVMANVVVAILLDEYLKKVDEVRMAQQELLDLNNDCLGNEDDPVIETHLPQKLTCRSNKDLQNILLNILKSPKMKNFSKEDLVEFFRFKSMSKKCLFNNTI